MIPTKFDYVRAETVEQAVRFMEESDGEGKIIAGGHSLLPIMKFRITEPGKLIDISDISAMKGVRVEGDRVIVGALTTHREVANHPIIKEKIPVLAEAARQIGDIQIRNRGTIGGNIAHGDPVADLPAPTLALEADLIVQGEDGLDVMDMEGFILGPLITMLPENSVVKEISFAIPPTHAHSAYLKYFHPATGYPVVGVAVVAGVGDSGLIDHIRVGITGVGDVAYRAKSVEKKLLGQEPSEVLIESAAELAGVEGDMGSDLFASEEYRANVCKVYTTRALKAVLL